MQLFAAAPLPPPFLTCTSHLYVTPARQRFHAFAGVCGSSTAFTATSCSSGCSAAAPPTASSAAASGAASACVAVPRLSRRLGTRTRKAAARWLPVTVPARAATAPTC
eukprot:303662-Chlamydomonas_euryale.AAC.4